MASAYRTSFLEAIKIRRSVLSLSKESPISDDRIELIVNHAIKHAPSPFDVQSCRAVILFGAEHEKLWDIGMAAAKNTLPTPVFAQYETKIQGFRDAYGTVLFFEDTDASKSLPQPLQDLTAKYPDWYEHSQGMNQFIAWTALATEGLGCNLQHYHPMINEGVAKTWDIPGSWSPRAQLVFGKPTGPPRGGVEKQFAPLETRVKVYGRKN
ncbi:related to oxidoreductase related to nitroreductase [Phialocephala subalpina]|uniref:Related to oxidoreductase related to nitroreductase n=1 Tax=Phialocephala subalpina TaxID=576137 RepID=A0A1L7X050_9HELO|nr:related to oxidoreductase related to nitroreductase [Phialocephala subalpina]